MDIMNNLPDELNVQIRELTIGYRTITDLKEEWIGEKCYKNGTYKTWSKPGVPKKIENFKNGELHGLQKKWYPSGKLLYSFNYKNGKLHGLQQKWYNNGNIFCQENYNNGKLDGFKKKWYKNGKLKF